MSALSDSNKPLPLPLIVVWRQDELKHINSSTSGPERKAALCELLEKEAELIASIGRHKNAAHENNREGEMKAFLEKVSIYSHNTYPVLAHAHIHYTSTYSCYTHAPAHIHVYKHTHVQVHAIHAYVLSHQSSPNPIPRSTSTPHTHTHTHTHTHRLQHQSVGMHLMAARRRWTHPIP